MMIASVSDEDTLCTQGSGVITHHQFGAKVQMDGSIFFFSKSIWKITSPFALSCPWRKTRKCTKETSPLIYVKTAICICLCSSLLSLEA